jgi:hypothetical protein
MDDLDLNPDFPVVNGTLPMPNNWSLTLPVAFNRRIEDGSLVLWTSELTFWINIWNNDAGLTMQQQAERILKDASAARSNEQMETGATLLRLSYELDDEPGSISGHVMSASGYVQIAAAFDTPQARALACQVIASVRQQS